MKMRMWNSTRRIRVRGILGLAMLSFALGAAPSAAEKTFEIYPLGQSDPAVAQAAIQELLGEGEKVMADPRHARLLVLAEPETQARVALLMRTLNATARNIRIDVEFDDRSDSRDVGAGLTGSGRVRIPVMGPPSGGFQGKIHLQDQRTQTTSRTVQTLVVSSGREATLRVGESVPYVDWFMDYGRRNGLVRGEVIWQNVGSSLIVAPVLIGDGPEIRVRLIPELSGQVDGKPFRLRVATASTDVIVRSGETISIGGLSQNQEFYSRFLFGAGTSGRTQALDIRLTPTVQ